MKSNPFVEHILYDIFDERDNISARPMMGAHVLYNKGKVFALAEDDTLYLKGNKDTGKWFLDHGSKKFSYEKKGKDGKKKTQEMNFFLVPESVLENREEFKKWCEIQEVGN